MPWVFELHLPTLFLLTIGINALLGGLLAAIYYHRQKQLCFLYWAVSCGLFALGTAAAGASVLIAMPWLTLVLADILLVASPLLMIIGIRHFLQQPLTGAGPVSLALTIAAFIGTLLVWHSDPYTTRALTALMTAILFTVAATILHSIKLSPGIPIKLLRSFFSVHAALMAIQVVVMAWPDTLPDTVRILEAILISHILLATCTALTLPLLVSVQTEQALKALSERDELTQLFNRRALFHKATDCFMDAVKRNIPLTVLMIDIDHFKRVNDRWGHATGDMALRFVGEFLRLELRDEDIIGRIGGEEFTAVLPNTSRSQGQLIAQRLCEQLAQSGHKIGGQPLGLSISVGVAHRNTRHSEFKSILTDADAALYVAKNNGRNAISISDSELPADTALSMAKPANSQKMPS
ncbi:GGDEF domain-containing protein [Marinobacter caseinilyticus]|uniref:GGDEF domain-containing protein n=1 Tax=Marinobacter caseinilyticus TaxID=2692195 RepID=UPI0014085FFB|nr:diguanylate cyclase [Marinobacter caseinilyticus]